MNRHLVLQGKSSPRWCDAVQPQLCSNATLSSSLPKRAFTPPLPTEAELKAVKELSAGKAKQSISGWENTLVLGQKETPVRAYQSTRCSIYGSQPTADRADMTHSCPSHPKNPKHKVSSFSKAIAVRSGSSELGSAYGAASPATTLLMTVTPLDTMTKSF